MGEGLPLAAREAETPRVHWFTRPSWDPQQLSRGEEGRAASDPFCSSFFLFLNLQPEQAEDTPEGHRNVQMSQAQK